MKYVAAAIHYLVDQNCPSDPFLLRLEMEDLSLDQIKESLLKYVEDEGLIEDEDPEDLSLELIENEDGLGWGKYAFEIRSGDTLIFISAFEEV